jgi:pimeloyl-ACP methyl ester carboxylesterase
VVWPRSCKSHETLTSIENKHFMNCAGSRVLAVSVLLFVFLICPLVCLGQRITVIDPSAASSKSIEDISTAALKGSQLRADPPQLLETADKKEFTREFVAVQWRPGDRIYLFVVRPVNVRKAPVAVYVYGHPSDTDRFQDDGWCQRTTSGGYAAVGLVPALTGQRYHDRPMKEWFVSELQESLSKSAHDVQMVLNYLDERGDMDMSNVGVFGVGAGGTIAVMAAAVDSRIKAIDLLDPWGDWPIWMQKSAVIPDEERPAYLKPEFLMKVADFDPVKLLPTLKTPRIRLSQLNDDFDSTPEEAKRQIEAALPATAEHHRFETSAAFYSEIASGGRVFDWLKLQIKAPNTKVREAAKETPPGTGSGSGK